MKKFSFAVAAVSLAVSSVISAAPEGGSSSSHVIVGPSTIAPGGTPGYSGIAFSSTGSAPYSGFADVLQAPINQAINGVDINNDGNRWATLPNDPNTVVAQVWQYTDKDAANIYSLRQVITPGAPMPVFGGLVIGQVKHDHDANPATPNQPYPLGQGVYFGEWAPQPGMLVGYPNGSTDLNMSHADRTVWYVGDDPVANMDSFDLVDVQYSVVGIARTGEANGSNANLPSAPDLYVGTLTANYIPSVGGDIDGTISNSVHTIDFAGTDIILGTGTFENTDPTKNISGHFYNDARALAGIYQGGAGTADDVAFGGSYNGSGTITP